MKVHFIAIGGSVMSQLAIALHKKGYKVSGSDDEIFDPAKSNLSKHNLLPASIGWNISSIDESLDAIILGMHAKPDNPELLKAQQLSIPVYSYPEFIYENTKSKKRVVVAGSHGKTTITAMVMHVLSSLNINFDYLVGAKLDGIDSQVKITAENNLIIIEGDEYLSSPIHRTPKIMYYQPAVTSISGIAWDHINVFPTENDYVQQFENYIKDLSTGCKIIYYAGDSVLEKMVEQYGNDRTLVPYQTPDFSVNNGKFEIEVSGQMLKLAFFGAHNIQNMECARFICEELGVDSSNFYTHIKSFKGAARRLQLLKEGKSWAAYNDFAHAPSKVKASVKAVNELWPKRKLIALLELHTYSSLNATFIKEYENALEHASDAVVYFNAHTLQIKQLPELPIQKVQQVFNHNNLKVFTNKAALENYLAAINFDDTNFLLMTSGNLSGIRLLDYLPD